VLIGLKTTGAIWSPNQVWCLSIGSSRWLWGAWWNRLSART